MKVIPKLLTAAVFLFIIIFLGNALIKKVFFTPTKSSVEKGLQVNKETSLNKSNPEKKDVEVVIENLSIPWDIAFLPGGDLLVTERAGNLLRISPGKKEVIKIEGVRHIGEGGLLGIALHPKFLENSFIYLYSTTGQGGLIFNRIERYKLSGNSLSERKVILSGTNFYGSSNHDGGRIDFGPDGYLYVTVGDAERPNLAQDKLYLNGKILRITDEGDAAPGNPFGNEVYSYGHRNPQGLAWDDKGNLWETEHGPSGTKTGNDEINLIKPGQNFGWPDFVGTQSGDGIITPVLESGKSDTWAPASLLYLNGSLFFGGLRGEALYQAKIISDDKVELKAHYKKDFGRIRTVRLGPDGYLYITTSNKDGRGSPKSGDDKIIKLNPDQF